MFEKVKATKVYELVIEQIKEQINKGELRCGDRLPPERELCEKLNVSRTSVREALRALEMLGIFECRQGGGNFIKDHFEDSLIEPLSMAFMLNGNKIEEVMQIRIILESETAALAAAKISDAQLKELKDMSIQLNNTEDEKTSAALDKKIHYKIVQAADNFLIVTMMNAISSLVDSYIENAIVSISRNEEGKKILKKQHTCIIQSIEAHNSPLAAATMKEHLEYADNYLKLHQDTK